MKKILIVAISLAISAGASFVLAAPKGDPGPPAKGCDQAAENDGDPYDSTCDGSPSENGKGGGNATGKPCAGCVGSADNKNPKGQLPNGSDPNNGYECDGNEGVGKGNPAHTSCDPYSDTAASGSTETDGSVTGYLEPGSDRSKTGPSGALILVILLATVVAVVFARTVVRRIGPSSDKR